MTDQQVGQTMKQKEIDPINHPAHYTSRGGIECIQAAERIELGEDELMILEELGDD